MRVISRFISPFAFLVAAGLALAAPAQAQAPVDQSGGAQINAPLAPLVPVPPAVLPPVATPPAAAAPAAPPAFAPAPLAVAPVAPPAIVPPALPAVVTPPPLPPPPPMVVYFSNQGGQPTGPLTITDVQARIQQGAIKSDTLVWKQGTPDWVAAKDQPEIAALLPVAPPPVPLSDQYKRVIVGTWQAQQQSATQAGVATSTTISYNSDGSYNALVTSTFQGRSIQQIGTGTWTVQAVSDGQFGLTMTPAGAGSLPLTVVLRVVDNNTLANDADRYQARRVR